MSWPLFISAFSFIFIAALPGRTTFVMLIMSAKGRPWGIFFGAALAFACQSFISVVLGRVLAFLPQHWVQIATGLLFIFFAYLFWRESSSTHSSDGKAGAEIGFIATARSAFLIVFAAEWGDVSQVAIASLSARQTEPLNVLIAAILALWLIAAMAVLIGSRLNKVISPRLIQRGASIIFLFIGLYLISTSFSQQ